MLIPSVSVLSAQSKVTVVTVEVEPLIGVDNIGTVDEVVSIRTDHVLDQEL
jgi:hypothetical protein